MKRRAASGFLREILRIEQHRDLVVRDDLVVALYQHREAALDRDGRRRLDRGRGVDALVARAPATWSGSGMLTVSTSEYFSPTDFSSALSVAVLLTPGAFMANFMPLKSVERLVATAVDVVLADENLGGAVAGRRGRLVGDDLDLDAAQHRVVEPGGGRARAGVELAGAERRHHVGGRAEIRHLDVEALLAEVSPSCRRCRSAHRWWCWRRRR